MMYNRLWRSSIVLFVLCCYAFIPLFAQDTTAVRNPIVPAQHVFWGGSPLRSIKDWSVGYHWRFRPSYALELRFSSFHHGDAAEQGLFNGDLNNNYFSIYWSKKRSYAPYEVEQSLLLEFGEKLGKVPEVAPISTNQFLLGWKFLLHKPHSRFYASLMPSFALSQHRFFRVRQFVIVEEKVTDRKVVPGPGFDLIETTVRTDYTDRRLMSEHQSWHVGMAYDIGLGYQITRNILVEGRVGGVFVPESPYEAPIPAPVKPLQAMYWLRVGVGF
jgi:hypothetical protein